MNEKYYCKSVSEFIGLLDELKNKPGSTVVISPGEYEITSDIAVKTQSDVMNGVYGKNPEKAMFNPSFEYSKGLALSSLCNITVEAYGVLLMINGFMEPVSITGCKNVTLKGISIDHKRKPYSKAIITKTEFIGDGRGFVTAQFGEEYPVNQNTPMPRSCIFDLSANRFSLYGEADIRTASGEEIAPQLWRFPFSNLFDDISGNELYVWHTFHSRPAILIENSADICLEDVSIHSQPGMGIVAHRCENLYFNRLHIVPSCGEHMSTNTDATHITSCKGAVEYNCCWFDGQGDDSVNIHTYYHKIEKTGENTCRLILDSPTGTHSQTPDYPDVGDMLEMTDIFSLAAKDIYKVIECKNIGVFSSELVLDKPLPQSCEGLYFADVSRQPHFSFHDCVCHSHLARSVLIKTKYASVENNRFIDVVGTAICVLGEAHWREGICTTQDIVIRRNHVSFGGRTKSIRQAGSAGITVSLCAEKPFEAVHERVVITDNIIDCPDAPHGIYVSNTKQLTLERNYTVSKNEPVIIEDFAEPDV